MIGSIRKYCSEMERNKRIKQTDKRNQAQPNMSKDENPLLECVIEVTEGLLTGYSEEESWRLLQSIPPNPCCGYHWSQTLMQHFYTLASKFHNLCFSQGHRNSLMISKGLCYMALLVTFSVLDLFLSLIIMVLYYFLSIMWILGTVNRQPQGKESCTVQLCLDTGWSVQCLCFWVQA